MSKPSGDNNITFDDINSMSAELSAPDGGQGPVANDVNARFIEEFRANGGQIPGDVGQAIDFLLVTVVGAKSGKHRTIPLAYFNLEGRIVIIASMAGSPRHPTWYINMRANPEVTVELGAGTYEATAVEVSGADRDALFASVCEHAPVFASYQEKTERKIPVVELVHKDWPTDAQ
ncbi:MAG: nitroreductase/quinone reductase family protein [Gammaproteobacteria bacterium]